MWGLRVMMRWDLGGKVWEIWAGLRSEAVGPRGRRWSLGERRWGLGHRSGV